MANFKEKVCKVSGHVWKQYNSLQKCPCSPCIEAREANKKPVIPKPRIALKKVSDKRKVENLQYAADRILFLNKPENRICFIDGCQKPSTTIEHRAGRWGKNFLDQSTWAGCCSEHNIELENNAELSKKYQLSKIHGGQKF